MEECVIIIPPKVIFVLLLLLFMYIVAVAGAFTGILPIRRRDEGGR